MASTTLDFPEPLGPTTAVIPGSKRRVVAEAKDLKPFMVRDLRCTVGQSLPGRWIPAPASTNWRRRHRDVTRGSVSSRDLWARVAVSRRRGPARHKRVSTFTLGKA